MTATHVHFSFVLNMLVRFTVLFLLLQIAHSSKAVKVSAESNPASCKPGDIYKKGCEVCLCSDKSVFLCYPISNCYSPSSTDHNLRGNNQECQPNKLYSNADGSKCICTKNGLWPHRSCRDLNSKCKPNHYVLVDCNVCRCGADGVIDQATCTHNTCEKKTRRSTSTNVYGNCEANHWYSLAPCQFCYCATENKLVCNTGIANPDTLQLGNYNLTVCGVDLVKEILQLTETNNALRSEIDRSSTQNTKETEVIMAEKQPSILNKIIDGVKDTLNKNIFTNDRNPKNKQDTNTSDDQREHSPQKSIIREINADDDYTGGNHNVGRDREDTESDRENNDNINNEGKSADKNDDDDKITIQLSVQKDNGGEKFEAQDEASEVSEAPSKKRYERIDDNNRSSDESAEVKPEHKIDMTKSVVAEMRETLKKRLPDVIDTVFDLGPDARRGDPVVIRNSTCTPGERTVIKCNSCFCLQNGKILCTDKKC